MRLLRCLMKGWPLMSIFLALTAFGNTAYGQPNVVLIMVDDLSPGDHPDDPDGADLYLNMDSVYTNIGSIADAGMKFRTMYATPVCDSSRAEILTGQYGFNNGYYDNRPGPYTPNPTSPYYDVGAKQSIAKVLRAKGYRAGIVGRWKLTGDPTRGMIYDAGFEDYYIIGSLVNQVSRYWAPTILDNGEQFIGGPDDYGPDLLAQWAVDYIEAHKEEKFFLYYPMALVHIFNKTVGYEDVPDGMGGRIPGSLQSNVAYVDIIVGRILDAIHDAGIEDDTIVIFTADNGTNYNHYDPNPYPGFKNNPTELGARVPFIVKYPGVVQPGVSSRQVTDFVDIAATIHHYTGELRIPIAEPLFDGVSLHTVLEDPAQGGPIPPNYPHKNYAFSYLENKRIIRDDEWVYENVDETGAGDLYLCLNARSIFNCTLQTEPYSQDAIDKIAEFQDQLDTNFPPPDIVGQDLEPPSP